MKLSAILKTEGIITVSPKDTLSLALSRLSSSHDAAFVLNEDENLLGVINPHYCLIKNSYPGNAKVEHCMMRPPKVHLETEVAEITRLMMESKIHYLPIYDNGTFVGIISARRILKSLLSSDSGTHPLAKLVRPSGKLHTIQENDTISHALHTFKGKRISKLVVRDARGKVSGILAFYDLISYLATPKKRAGSGDRKGIKTPTLNSKVRNFMKSSILTLPKSAPIRQAIEMILDRKIGSIIVVDENYHPIDLVTTQDIFSYMFQPAKQPRLQVVSKNVSRFGRSVLPRFTRHFGSFIRRRGTTKEAKLYVEEEKKGLYKVLLSLIPFRGRGEYIAREGRDLEKVLAEVKDTAKRLQENTKKEIKQRKK